MYSRASHVLPTPRGPVSTTGRAGSEAVRAVWSAARSSSRPAVFTGRLAAAGGASIWRSRSNIGTPRETTTTVPLGGRTAGARRLKPRATVAKPRLRAARRRRGGGLTRGSEAVDPQLPSRRRTAVTSLRSPAQAGLRDRCPRLQPPGSRPSGAVMLRPAPRELHPRGLRRLRDVRPRLPARRAPAGERLAPRERQEARRPAGDQFPSRWLPPQTGLTRPCGEAPMTPDGPLSGRAGPLERPAAPDRRRVPPPPARRHGDRHRAAG